MSFNILNATLTLYLFIILLALHNYIFIFIIKKLLKVQEDDPGQDREVDLEDVLDLIPKLEVKVKEERVVRSLEVGLGLVIRDLPEGVRILLEEGIP